MKIKSESVPHDSRENFVTVTASGESSDVHCTMSRTCHVNSAAVVEKRLARSVEKSLIENGG